MTFKTVKHKIPERQEEQKKTGNSKNIYENNSHGAISVQYMEEEMVEDGMSASDKREHRVSTRLNELEKIGVKRGLRRKLFSVIGITLMFIVSLVCMYLCFILLSDIINLVELTDESIIKIPNN